ncbi:hypothetical protein, partial [Luteimonas deserti]
MIIATQALDMEIQAQALSFTALEARLRDMPGGPASILKTPSWIRWLNVAGTVAVGVGLLPFLLVQFLTPQMWMVHMAQVGVGSAWLLYGPGMARG